MIYIYIYIHIYIHKHQDRVGIDMTGVIALLHPGPQTPAVNTQIHVANTQHAPLRVDKNASPFSALAPTAPQGLKALVKK